MAPWLPCLSQLCRNKNWQNAPNHSMFRHKIFAEFVLLCLFQSTDFTHTFLKHSLRSHVHSNKLVIYLKQHDWIIFWYKYFWQFINKHIHFVFLFSSNFELTFILLDVNINILKILTRMLLETFDCVIFCYFFLSGDNLWAIE